MLKLQKRFRSVKHNIFTKEINKIELSVNDGKKMQSIDSAEECAYGTSKGLICKNEEIKSKNILKQ